MILAALGMLIQVAETRVEPPRKQHLSIHQAAALVDLVVLHDTRDVHPRGNFSLDPMAIEPDKRFKSFEALGVWRSEGSAVLGNYSVNLATADVWNLSKCKRIEFPRLTALQTRYRRHLSHSAARLLRNLRPDTCR
jgi:hypothetical protein